MPQPPPTPHRRAALAMVASAAPLLAGCGTGMERIDRIVSEHMKDGTSAINGDVVPQARIANPAPIPNDLDPWNERPGTVNPMAGDLTFTAAGIEDAEQVMARLIAYGESTEEPLRMTLSDALLYAVEHSRDYRFAEESYVLNALELLVERHLWGPRFFNDVSADIVAVGDDGFYDSSLSVVNDFQVTQRLPYGGEVSARVLAGLTRDLHSAVSSPNTESADVILAANIPLLRGAGRVAREELVQAERDLIYAAREFERFRREFLFDTARAYLDLVVSKRRVDNAERNLASFQRLEAAEDAKYRAGRSTPFDKLEAQNETLDAVDGLNASAESYRVALDNFKIRIGMTVEQALEIVPDELGLPEPKVDMELAVFAGMSYRLDLQTLRDQVDDAARDIEVARNNLLGDLDFRATASIPSNDRIFDDGLRLRPRDSVFTAGVTYGMPLDRETERASLRRAEIGQARAIRAHDRFRDEVALNVRAAVRGIDSALFSLQIQERALEVALGREASIEADPARANLRQKRDAINATARARDSRDDADRNLEVAILGYLLETGTLRVSTEGRLIPLDGMELDPNARPAIEQPDPVMPEIETNP